MPEQIALILIIGLSVAIVGVILLISSTRKEIKEIQETISLFQKVEQPKVEQSVEEIPSLNA